MPNDFNTQPLEKQNDSFPIALLETYKKVVSTESHTLESLYSAHLSSPTVGEKAGSAWMPVDHPVGKRSGKAARSLSFLALDVDGMKEGGVVIKPAPAVEVAVAALQREKLHAILHTSHSHLDAAKDNVPKYRIVMALRRPLALAGGDATKTIRALGMAVAKRLGLSDVVDTSTMEPARLFYGWRVPDEAGLLRAQSFLLTGEPLDADALLAELAAALPLPPATAPTITTPSHALPTSTRQSVIAEYCKRFGADDLLDQYPDYSTEDGKRWLWKDSTSGKPGVVLLENGHVSSHHADCPISRYQHERGKNSVDAFGVYCAMEHGGDDRAAVRAAARHMGMPMLDAEQQTRRNQAANVVQLPTPTPAPMNQGKAREEGMQLAQCGFISEYRVAMELLPRVKNRYRWTLEMDWLVNRGTHWERDCSHANHSEIVQHCAKKAQRLANWARDILEKEGGKIDPSAPLTQEAIALQKRIAGILKTARELAGKVENSRFVSGVQKMLHSNPAIATKMDAWDSSREVLNTLGAPIDLRSGAEIERGTNTLFLEVAGAAPLHTRPDLWLRFLSEIFAGDADVIEFMQRLCGYFLTGSVREQKLFFFYGTGANGKSVLANILQHIMGSYAISLRSSELMSRGITQSHPTAFAGLRGKRLAVSSEVADTARWDESLIKELTGGDKISARFMHKDFFDFLPTHKHLILGNYKPRLKGDDFAMARRMVLVPFSVVFPEGKRDESLERRLKKESGAILQWAIEGAVKWARDGLKIPGSIQAASREYMAEMDDVGRWIEECCDIDPTMKCTASDAYRSYALWKESQNERAPAQRIFGERLSRKVATYRVSGERGYKGLHPRQVIGYGEIK